MATIRDFYIVAVILLLICSVVFAPIGATNKINGFTLDLIHRDSPISPFYNPSETQADRLQKSARRFYNRINSGFNTRMSQASYIKTEDLPIIDLYTNNGEYIVNVTIGTPPVPYLAIADTGSNIMWTQCQPCKSCFSQPFPIFDPNLSSSYKLVECDSPACALVSPGACGSGGQSRVCNYTINYADKSFTKGLVATETLTIGSFSVPNIVFGCGTNNVDSFPTHGISGVMGLDNGPASLISQLNSSINGKFSYCLVPIGKLAENRSSKMKFGADALVTLEGVASTPLVVKPNLSAYFVTLLAVGVGSERFDVTSSATAGNLMVDTGTTYTTLPIDVYNNVVESLVRQVQKPKVDNPPKFFKLCFATKDDIIDPAVMLYFSGAGLKLGSESSFARVNEDITCFAIFPSDNSPILGNLAQMDVLVGFDLQAKTFAFTGADCSRQ